VHCFTDQQVYEGLASLLVVPFPVAVTATLTGVRGLVFADGRYHHPLHPETPIDRDVVMLPDILVEKPGGDPAAVMRPILDAMWNAAGSARCWNYNEQGKWVVQR